MAKAPIKKSSGGKKSASKAAPRAVEKTGKPAVRGVSSATLKKSHNGRSQVGKLHIGKSHTPRSNNGKVAKVVAAPLMPARKSAPAKVAKAVPAVEVKSSNNHKPGRVNEREERRGFVVPTPVPTDTKPARNRAGLRSHELEHYRDLLLAKRRELVGDMTSMESEALQRGGNSNLSNLPIHMADMGTDNYEQEFTLGLMEKDRNLLREINSALAKIQDGTYGICEGTDNPISKARLEAQPWARYSIEHARKLEQRGVR